MRRLALLVFLLTLAPACGNSADEILPDAGAPEVDAGPGSGTELTNPLGLTATIAPDPPILGRNAMTVKVLSANGIPVVGCKLTVSVFMPAMGHGSSETPVVTEVGNGEYSVSKVTFTMYGQWRVTLTATRGTLTGTQVLTYTVN
jgi:hypothetical protein